MRILFSLAAILFVVAFACFWWLTRPAYIEPSLAASLEKGDAQLGRLVFYAGGCGSCHAVKGAKGEEKLKLGGQHPLKTPFGTFYAPNISPDKTNGIGAWTGLEFANAMVNGVSPNGSHYYPAFPYASYRRATYDDIADLWAFLKTLEPVATENLAHDLPLPFRLRRGLGLWKWLFLDDGLVANIETETPAIQRGRYLVEGMAHCGECHTPRNLLGGMKTENWLAGGPAPEGEGSIPNITPHADGIGSWSENDLVYSFQSGLTPSFDSFGGSMVSVQDNLSNLSESDLKAIAAYLMAIQPVAGPSKK